MKHIFILTTLVFLCILSCKKEVRDPSAERLSGFVAPEPFDFAAEEKQFVEDETNNEDTYEPEAILMKVTYITTKDSLPYYKSTDPTVTTKQKYGRRQIISDSFKTRMKLYGYGFKPQNANSKVLCRVKNDTIGFAEIISWSDTAIIYDIPSLPILYRNKTFSMKFKVFCSNPVATKPPISRSKSRGCISQMLATTVLTTGGSSGGGGTHDTTSYYVDTVARNIIKNLRISYGFGGLPSGTWTRISTNYNYIPQKGDLLSNTTTSPNNEGNAISIPRWCG